MASYFLYISLIRLLLINCDKTAHTKIYIVCTSPKCTSEKSLFSSKGCKAAGPQSLLHSGIKPGPPTDQFPPCISQIFHHFLEFWWCFLDHKLWWHITLQFLVVHEIILALWKGEIFVNLPVKCLAVLYRKYP